MYQSRSIGVLSGFGLYGVSNMDTCYIVKRKVPWWSLVKDGWVQVPIRSLRACYTVQWRGYQSICHCFNCVHWCSEEVGWGQGVLVQSNLDPWWGLMRGIMVQQVWQVGYVWLVWLVQLLWQISLIWQVELVQAVVWIWALECLDLCFCDCWFDWSDWWCWSDKLVWSDWRFGSDCISPKLISQSIYSLSISPQLISQSIYSLSISPQLIYQSITWIPLMAFKKWGYFLGQRILFAELWHIDHNLFFYYFIIIFTK